MKKNDKTKKLIISIITVVLMIIMIVGGTFAYFQWTSGEEQRTNVNITVAAGQITMHIEPEKTVFTNLVPMLTCKSSYTAYGDALVSIINNTGTIAIPSFKLSAKVTKGGTGTLTSEALSHIHYSIVAIATDENTGTKDDTIFLSENISSGNRDIWVSGDCETPLKLNNANVDAENLSKAENFYNDNTTNVATGTFATVSTSGEWSDLPSAEGEYLPRQYDTYNFHASGVTFEGKAGTTSYQWFRVYIWIDDGYTAITTGNKISDPLQNAKIEVTWSTNSIVEQVAKTQ